MKNLLLTTIAAVVLVGCGESPKEISIHDAAAAGDIEAVKQHLAAGTDVNAKDFGFSQTALHFAVIKGHKEIVELLISNGADVNAKDGTEWPALHHAAQDGYKEIAELLIANGADVNMDGGFAVGGPALHYAIGNNHKEIVELLITNGADLNAKDEDGETALDRAVFFKNHTASQNHTEIADLLRKHGGKTGEELKAEGK